MASVFDNRPRRQGKNSTKVGKLMPVMKQLKRLSEGSKGSLAKKNLLVRATGKFYTPQLITNHLVSAVLLEQKLWSTGTIKLVEPFCGDGRLVIELLRAVRRVHGSGKRRRWEIHLWDCDQAAVATATREVASAARMLGEVVKISAEVGNSFEIAARHFGQFDICVTNPPWQVLKPDRRELDHLDEKSSAEYVRLLRVQDEQLGALFPRSAPLKKFSGWGTNLARCGTEAALRLVKIGGVAGIVSPSSLVADQMSERLRQWLFNEHVVVDLAYYVAEARLFEGVDQPCITLVARVGGGGVRMPKLTKYDRDQVATSLSTNSSDWDEIAQSGYVLPFQSGLSLLKLNARLRDFPTLGELESSGPVGLWAGRELDETGHQSYLASRGTHLFVKGRMVRRFGLAEKPTRFVGPNGPKMPKSTNFYRLVWRDVARPNQKRRMHATIIPPGQVTGNSLGVAYYRDNDVRRLKALLGIFNSLVFEGQARTYLATAHVSLGAVRQVRVPSLDDTTIDRLSSLVELCLKGSTESELDIEVFVAKLYGLSQNEFAELLVSFEKIEEPEKAALLADHRWSHQKREVGPTATRAPLQLVKSEIVIPNHYCASLSELDLQIVNSVPPGGNWKNIPESVPSERLKQIRKSYAAGEGSRSTYYGRLRADAPAYTINTYFSRPGNGCHIHYEQARTLSQREAARLQSFPDSFRFHGGRGSVANQIGNAVPPLLGYQIAKSLPFKGKFVDLFCGAGGLGLGFTWAGWESVVANDIDKYALVTYQANIHPETICGDISDKSVFDAIVEKCLNAKRQSPRVPFFVLGGPPCQGFSTAGNKRSMADDRNWLFRQYRQLLALVKPDGFVFENVTGLLNMEGGRVFEMIQHELQQTSKHIAVWKLRAEEYGVPQRRTRVVLLGSNKGKPPSGQPERVTQFGDVLPLFSSLPPAVTVAQALSDLPPVRPSEDGSAKDYLCEPANPYQALMRGRLTTEEFLAALETKSKVQSPSSVVSARR